MSSRSWLWTLFTEKMAGTEEDLQGRLNKSEYSIYGAEICPNTKANHLQGFSYRKSACTMSAMKKFLGQKTIHLEVANGTAEQNTAYCSKGNQPSQEWKEEKTAGPNYGKDAKVWTVGTMPKQGVRQDIIDLRDSINNKRSLSEMLCEDVNLGALAKHGRFAEMCFQASLKVRTRPWRELEVIIHYGATGTGKTRTPYDLGAYKWEPSSPEWWDGYDGEDILLIDEFYGQLKPSRLLALLDGYQLRLPIKGGHTYAQWTKVYITSNVAPVEWFSDKVPNEVKLALKRRITKIVKFTEDGVTEEMPFLPAPPTE